MLRPGKVNQTNDVLFVQVAGESEEITITDSTTIATTKVVTTAYNPISTSIGSSTTRKTTATTNPTTTTTTLSTTTTTPSTTTTSSTTTTTTTSNYIITTYYTNYALDDGKTSSLANHIVQCPTGQALIGFHLQRNNDNTQLR